MVNKLPIALLAIAAATAAVGGALQRAHGAGTAAGLHLVHIGAGVFVIAMAVAFVAWISTASAEYVEEGNATAADGQPGETDGSDRRPDRAFIVANDGANVIPVLGPYASEPEASADLTAVQQRLDPQGQYEWSVDFTADETLVGQANKYFEFAERS